MFAMDLSFVGLKNQLYSEQKLDIFRKSRQACKKKLKVLQVELRRLKVQVQRLDIALAPHNKLPPEVLRRIFELCCEGPEKRFVDQNIFMISHVCPLWRQIALSTPEFWTNITIFQNCNNKRNEHKLQFAEQCFSRAGNHPRSLVLYYCKTKLQLSLPHTQVMPLKELLNGPFFSYLEVLDTPSSQTELEERWPNLFAPTTRLTKLIHFRVSDEWTKWNVQSLMTTIPWSQLQDLELRSWIPYSHCLNILSEGTSLVRCRMNVDDGQVAMSSTRRPVILPALCVLHLVLRPSFRASHCVEQFGFLSVPRLSHLTLGQESHSSAYSANPGAPAICELLQSSNGMPDLVSLDLEGSCDTCIDVGALLTNTPRLQLLRVKFGKFDEEVRNAIATGTLVPQLSSITSSVDHEAIDILRMIELRHQNARMTPRQVTEFSRVSFSCPYIRDSKQSSDFRKRLARLQKATPNSLIIFWA